MQRMGGAGPYDFRLDVLRAIEWIDPSKGFRQANGDGIDREIASE